MNIKQNGRSHTMIFNDKFILQMYFTCISQNRALSHLIDIFTETDIGIYCFRPYPTFVQMSAILSSL